jgi:hypothetical protein
MSSPGNSLPNAYAGASHAVAPWQMRMWPKVCAHGEHTLLRILKMIQSRTTPHLGMPLPLGRVLAIQECKVVHPNAAAPGCRAVSASALPMQ